MYWYLSDIADCKNKSLARHCIFKDLYIQVKQKQNKYVAIYDHIRQQTNDAY